MFLLWDFEFVQTIDEVLRDDTELARLDAESTMGRGCRSTDDLAGPTGHGTDEVLVLLAKAFARIIAHPEEPFADHGIVEQFRGEGFRQKNKNLVCRVTGGPCKIISRTAATTHGGLGIKASEFDIVAQHLVDTLNKFKVPEKEHKELMAIIATLRPDIVEVEDE